MPLIAYNAMILRPPYSGVERAVLDLIIALHRYGTLDYHVFAPRAACEQLPPPDARLTITPISATSTSRWRRIVWEQGVLPRLLRNISSDMLHAPAYVAPHRTPCPAVVSVYDLEPLDHPERCRRSNRWHYRLALPGTLRRAAAIIVPSETTRDALLRRLPECSERLHIVPLAVNDGFFAPPDDTPAPGPPAAPYVLHVGNCEPRKNLPRLIAAMVRVRKARPDLTLRLTGGKGWHEHALRRAIDAHDAADWVQRMGHVPDDVLPTLYRQATCLAFPSLDEGFGLPPLEAMAAGCPVVSSLRGGLAETCRDAAEPCDPMDEQSIANAIRRLLDTPAHRAELITAGHRRASRYRWPDIARQTEAVYLTATS